MSSPASVIAAKVADASRPGRNHRRAPTRAEAPRAAVHVEEPNAAAPRLGQCRLQVRARSWASEFGQLRRSVFTFGARSNPTHAPGPPGGPR